LRAASRGLEIGSLAIAILAVVLNGCDAPTPAERTDVFRPEADLAEAALKASLQAWREGRVGGPASALSRKVEVSDSYRSAGRPLKAYQVLGAVGSDEIRSFAVRLSFENPPEDEVVRYVVIGNDPLWVFRQEDFERIAHWEHKMKEESEAGSDPASSAPARAAKSESVPR
jgi:hypothetical protein